MAHSTSRHGRVCFRHVERENCVESSEHTRCLEVKGRMRGRLPLLFFDEKPFGLKKGDAARVCGRFCQTWGTLKVAPPLGAGRGADGTAQDMFTAV